MFLLFYIYDCRTSAPHISAYIQGYLTHVQEKKKKNTHVFYLAARKSLEGVVLPQPLQLRQDCSPREESTFTETPLPSRVATTAWPVPFRPHRILLLFQSRGGDIPFSILVLNLLLGARAHTLRDSLDNGFFSADFDYSSSFIAQPILRTVWQNNTRPSHYIFSHIFPHLPPISNSHILPFPPFSKKLQNLKCISPHPNRHSET